ncbi:MAG: hypothetical protein ABSD47_18210, partial [Candidatus Methylomirabilota bacterium]
MAENQPESKAIRRVERALTGSPAAETVLNIFKAVLASAPFTGGISSLITDYIPGSRFRRLEEFAEHVANDLKEVSVKIDADKLNTDEFAFIFERAFRGAAEHYQREKLDAFRGILVNAAIRSDGVLSGSLRKGHRSCLRVVGQCRRPRNNAIPLATHRSTLAH